MAARKAVAVRKFRRSWRRCARSSIIFTAAGSGGSAPADAASGWEELEDAPNQMLWDIEKFQEQSITGGRTAAIETGHCRIS